jgi:hypothetical protein
VWISSGCGSAVVRRSSRSLHGFGVSLPLAWSPPTLIRYKVSYLLFFSNFTLLFSYFYTQPSYLSTYCREDRATPVPNITWYISTLNAFEAILHPAYLCMKIPSKQGPIAIHGGQEASRRAEESWTDSKTIHNIDEAEAHQ